MQIFFLLVLWNGAVQHPIDKTADGGHWRFELVRDIADKALCEFFELLQIARHVIKRNRQFVNLIAAVIFWYTHTEITCRKFACCIGHRLERAGHAAGQKIRHDERTAQRNQNDNQEDFGHFLKHADNSFTAGRHKDHRQRISAVILAQRTDYIMFARKQRA